MSISFSSASASRMGLSAGMTVYVCGPMAGRKDLNRAEFDRAAQFLANKGLTPILPHNIDPFSHDGECAPVYGYAGAEEAHDGGCYLRGDIAEMVMCDAIYRLSGWEESTGAKMETEVAHMLMIPIVDESA